jgi:hypothetical protein
MIRQAKPKIGRGCKVRKIQTVKSVTLSALGVQKKMDRVYMTPTEVAALRAKYISSGLIKTNSLEGSVA